MRKKNLKYVGVILIAAIAFAGFKYYEGNQKRESVINSIVYDALVNAHFQPKEVDDKLSVDVFESYIESLDYGKRYLTKSDLKLFEGYKKQLDDQFKANQLEFFDQSYQVIQSRIKESKKR